MDIKIVKQLADLMAQKDLATLEVCEGEHKIVLTRQAAAPAAPPAQGPEVRAAAPRPDEAPEAQAAEAPGEALTAPLVGVAYLSPAPDAEPFVKLGDKVKKGQPLCIIEAMKVMNEFTAPRAGVVSGIYVENEQVVEFGQCLFRLV